MTTLMKLLYNSNFYKILPIPIIIFVSLGLYKYKYYSNFNLLLFQLINNLKYKINQVINNLKYRINSIIKPEKLSSKSKNKLKKMIIFNDMPFHDEILRYIYVKYSDKINEFNYSSEKIYHFNEWRYRRKEKPVNLKIFKPYECNINIIYKGYPLMIEFKILKNLQDDFLKRLIKQDCSSEEELVTKLELQAESKELLTNFADESKEWCDKEKETIKQCNKETMNIYYYKKDYWALLSKSPKRTLSTVYLKKGVKEKLIKSINEFFSKETRDIYLSFGIPYKSINLIHGPPGTGKTSLIRSIASELDCDLYVLPISKDMLDTHLVDAFSYINDNEDKERIIVIEDIDTLFDDTRKQGDTENNITLQAFLNCLDGFTCIDGTMLFLTANKPEVLDHAMIRSCRIDYKLKLDYADKYQTKQMFSTFLPDQINNFTAFYNEIKHKEFTTAALQEFLFYNRNCNNILKIIDKFINIIEKNDPKNFEILKNENKNFYS